MIHLEKINYFIHLHDVKVNQKYDENGMNLPFSFHLKIIEQQAYKFEHLLEKDFTTENLLDMIVACYAHDAIEDARLTYNDIKNKFGVVVADIVFLCTEFKGKNPDERHPVEFYKQLATNKLAVYVKLCDVIANALYSVMTNNKNMLNKSKKRFDEKFMVYCYIEEFKEMYDYLKRIYELGN